MKEPPPLSFDARALLYTQLAALEKAGLPSERAFATVKMSGVAGQRLAAAKKQLARGKNPAEAGRLAGLFDALEFALIDAAIAAGSPARTYARLADYYTSRATQAKAIRGRMLMPAFVLLVSLFTAPLPGLVAGSIGPAGYAWKIAWPLILLGLLIWSLRSLPAWARGTPWQARLEALMPALPFFGGMHVRSNARDFFESLALMLEAGIPMFDALPKACATVQNGLIRVQYERILPAMRGGATLAQALEPLPFLGEESVVAFAQTGEESGTLGEMLMRHANRETEAINSFYEQCAIWVPRLAYCAAAAWAIHGILTGPGIMPQVPDDL